LLTMGLMLTTVAGVAFAEVKIGTNHRDTLIGTAQNDTLRGLEGNDRLVGRGDSDQLFGGAGDDTIAARDGERDFITCRPSTTKCLRSCYECKLLSHSEEPGLGDGACRRSVQAGY
jgi:uncharacterized protein YqfA (UPF0365 family)